jgi:hypothetical protein
VRVFAWGFGVLLFVLGCVGGLLLAWEALLAPSPGGVSGSISLSCTTIDLATTCNGPTTQGTQLRELTQVVLYAALAVAGVVGGAVLMAAGVLARRARPAAQAPGASGWPPHPPR